MTAALDRTRLARVLGRLGSDFDGEALTAARMAHRMMRAAGETWIRVLASEPDRPQRCDCHQCTAERLLSRARALTDWEIAFCAKVLRYERAPSAKQAAVLDKLSRRLGFDTS
jgi:hypothetical protein